MSYYDLTKSPYLYRYIPKRCGFDPLTQLRTANSEYGSFMLHMGGPRKPHWTLASHIPYSDWGTVNLDDNYIGNTYQHNVQQTDAPIIPLAKDAMISTDDDFKYQQNQQNLKAVNFHETQEKKNCKKHLEIQRNDIESIVVYQNHPEKFDLSVEQFFDLYQKNFN